MKIRKKVLVTGNGFDLAHCLPTTYSDFIDVINHLIEQSSDGN